MDFLPDPHDQDLNTVCIITGLTPCLYDLLKNAEFRIH